MFSSVAQSCPTFRDSMGCRTPGLPLQHQLPELTQTHVHWVSDAIHPSHPLLSPSPPTFNLSQHQGLFHWVSSSHQVAKVLEFQCHHQSFQWIFRISFKVSFKIDWLDLIAVQETFKGFLPTPRFRSINSLVLSFLYSPSLTSIHDYWKNRSFDQTDLCWQSNVSAF